MENIKEFTSNLEKSINLQSKVDEINSKILDQNRKIHNLSLEFLQLRKEFSMNELFIRIQKNEERFLDELERTRQSMKKVLDKIDPEKFTDDELKRIVEVSGVGYKELAEILGFKPSDTSSVTKYVNGTYKDQFKRNLIYTYCQNKILSHNNKKEA